MSLVSIKYLGANVWEASVSLGSEGQGFIVIAGHGSSPDEALGQLGGAVAAHEAELAQ